MCIATLTEYITLRLLPPLDLCEGVAAWHDPSEAQIQKGLIFSFFRVFLSARYWFSNGFFLINLSLA